MKKVLLLLSIIPTLMLNAQTTINTNLIGFHQDYSDNILRFDFIDTSDYSIQYSSELAFSTQGDVTIHGAFWSNSEEKLFFIMDSTSYNGNRHLYELDLIDYSVEKVLDIGAGEYWADITMTDDGRLFGITANQSNTIPSQTFCEIDRTTGATTQLFNIGIAGITAYQKYAMAYANDDAKIYLIACGDTPVDTSVLYVIDPVSLEMDTVEMSKQFEQMGAMHYIGNDEFITYDWPTDSIHVIGKNGVVTDRYDYDFGYDITGITDFNIMSTAQTRFCANEDMDLMSLGTANSYAWSQDGTALPETSNAITIDGVGTYELTLTTDSFVFNQPIDITTLNVPNVTLSPNDTTICDDATISLTGSNGGSSQWYMNGVAIVGADSNVYVASDAGIYNMTKTNMNGCTDSANLAIMIMTEDCDTVIDNVRDIYLNSFSVYPNPTSNELNVSVEDFENGSILKIYDIIGNEILTEEISNNKNTITINVEDFNAGIYLIKINNGEIAAATKFYKK